MFYAGKTDPYFVYCRLKKIFSIVHNLVSVETLDFSEVIFLIFQFRLFHINIFASNIVL